jgi:tetratricopeptide (TPR) repeat protein
MRKILVIAGLVLFVLPDTALAQHADGVRCNAEPLNAEQIQACTNLLPVPFTPGDMAAVHYRRALGYQALGQLDDVIVDTSRAIELLNGFDRKIGRIAAIRYSAYLLRAKTYEAKGQSDLAKADIEKLATLTWNRAGEKPAAEVYNSRAWYYHLIGADAKGLPDVMKALELDPKQPNFIETRAEIYEKMGRREEAVADYRAALAGTPIMQSAKDGLARLGATP